MADAVLPMRSLLAAVVVVAAGCASSHTATPPAAQQPASTVTASCHVRPGPLPDPKCTPGAVDGRVTQANIATTICQPGYTATVRPPTSYTNGLKRQQMRQYGLSGSPALFEEDHRVPLRLGGAPKDPANLWPEGWERTGAAPKGFGAESKDQIEDDVGRRVCSAPTAAEHMTLAEGQAVFLGDYWTWNRSHP